MKINFFIKSLIAIIFCCIGDSGFSAGPITHVYLAQKWLTIQGEELEYSQSFFLGTLFPDIRYLGEVTREETHAKNVTIEAITLADNSFLAGALLHAFVDEKREELVVKRGIYDYLKSYSDEHLATLLKLIEDEILFEFTNALFLKSCLKSFVEEEIASGISTKNLERWHLSLSFYFNQRPSELLVRLRNLNKGLFDIPVETVALWSEILPTLAASKELVDYVDEMVNTFENLFLSHVDFSLRS